MKTRRERWLKEQQEQLWAALQGICNDRVAKRSVAKGGRRQQDCKGVRKLSAATGPVDGRQ